MNRFIINKIQPFFIPFALLFSYFIYSPGFSGTFLFDDGVNLGQFVEIRVGNEGLWQFFSHTERPLAFLSFMLNDNVWPSASESFIKTNVLLHLLSACLLMICLILIGKNLAWDRRKRESVAMFATLIWMVHPFFVSTVLYIVQRMTILSAMFVVLSLISYLYGRLQLNKGNNKAWFWLIFATPIFGLFGFLCKENAALIPFYLLTFEAILFSNEKQTSRYYLLWKRCYIYLPIIIMLVCVFIFKNSWINDYSFRSFSLIERLLTQANILVYYLFMLLIPKSSTTGLHYENYPISTSLIEPWTTLLAVIFIVSIILFSIFYRKKYPILTFSILFFFFGHLMESTFIALELYFEHRNYLPSMMFFFALAHILFLCYDKYKRSVILAALTIVFTYSGLTYARSDLWGNPLLLLSVWTENNPSSSRNYIEGHVQAHRLHRYDLAQKFLERGIEALPDNIFLRIGYTSYGCGRGSLLKSDVEKLKIMLGETEQTISHYLYQNLAQLLGTSFSPDCKLITHEDMREIISSVLNNPNILTYELRLHEMLHLMGRFELQVENYSEAKEAFLKSLLLNLNPSTALQQVALIATFEQYELAYEYLKETRELIYGRDDVELRKQSAGWEEFEYMESVLLEELKDMPLRN
jgi:hypothetical protein